MFTGAISDKLRKYISSQKEIFAGKNISVIASGNFSFEQIVSGIANSIFSSDISLYTYVLGMWLQDKRAEVEVTSHDYKFIEDHDSDHFTAAMVLILEIAKFAGQKNHYQKRMFKHYSDNFSLYVENTCERMKVVKSKTKIDGFLLQDATITIDQALENGKMIASFLPTYSGGYEKIYKVYESYFKYPIPEYSLIDDEKYSALHERIRRGDHFFITDRELFPKPVCAIQENGRRTVFVYSNLLEKPKFFDYSKLNEEVKNFRLLTDEDIITEKSVITFVETKNNVINHYRFLFLSKKVERVVNGQKCFLLFIDEKLFGFLIFADQKYNPMSGEYFLLSDFVVNSSHARLSKLLVCLARSKEIIEHCEANKIQVYDKLSTAIFTNKPVSMKYRGVWTRTAKKDGCLTYSTPVKDKTIQEEFRTWYQKHYKRSTTN